MMEDFHILPIISFILCTLWVKPWRTNIASYKLLTLLFVDALSFSSMFSLNFYKIYTLMRSKRLLADMNREHKIYGLCFLGISFVSGIVFVSTSPSFDLFTFDSSPLDSIFFRMMRNQFSLLTFFLFGYELYKQLKLEGWNTFFNGLIFVGYVITIGIAIEVFFKIDLFKMFAGGRDLLFSVHYDRARGFSFEPRGASIVLTLVFVANLFFARRINFILNVLVFSFGIMLTKAFSGLIVMCLLLSITLCYGFILKNGLLLRRILYSSIVLVMTLFLGSHYIDFETHLRKRSFVYKNIDSENIKNPSLYFNFVSKFEVHDSSYLNFLGHYPAYLFTGTGSGLAGVASQKYVLDKDRESYPDGSKALPLMGAIYLLSQYGIFSIFFLVAVLANLNSWRPEGKIIFNLILITAGLQQHFLMPFVVCSGFFFLSEYPFFKNVSSVKEAKKLVDLQTG